MTAPTNLPELPDYLKGADHRLHYAPAGPSFLQPVCKTEWWTPNGGQVGFAVTTDPSFANCPECKKIVNGA